MKKLLSILLVLSLFLLVFSACNSKKTVEEISDAIGEVSEFYDSIEPETTKEIQITLSETKETEPETQEIDENGFYDSKEEVSLYIHTYNKLPENYITKKEAQSLGWEGGGLDDFAKGKCIGGDHFGNYDGKLPDKKGRKYFECDIDTMGAKKRGAKRIIYSNDGLIYYTGDHYETFTLLYGDE